jgi:hypothetical protein
MAANECIPYFDAGEDVTAVADGPVVGKTFVTVSANQLGNASHQLDAAATGGNFVAETATAGDRADGVASYDARDGERFYIVRGKKVVPVTAGEDIAAGVEVEVGTDGLAVESASGVAVGRAFDGASEGDDLVVALY